MYFLPGSAPVDGIAFPAAVVVLGALDTPVRKGEKREGCLEKILETVVCTVWEGKDGEIRGWTANLPEISGAWFLWWQQFWVSRGADFLLFCGCLLHETKWRKVLLLLTAREWKVISQKPLCLWFVHCYLPRASPECKPSPLALPPIWAFKVQLYVLPCQVEL